MLRSQLLGEDGGAAADGVDAPQRNVAGRCLLRQQADDLALGKHGAHTVDGHRLRPLHKGIDGGDVAAYPAHGHFQKPARSGGALVVHQEVLYLPAGGIQQDHLAVLPADVDDRVAAGTEKSGPGPVAGDLRDGLVRLRQQRPAIAGGHHKGGVWGPQFLIEPMDDPAGGGAAGLHSEVHDLLSVKQHRLGHGGAGIDSHSEQFCLPPVVP